MAAILITGACGFTGILLAQEDVEGSKDHPLLSRMTNSFITEYKQQFDAVDFATSATAKQTVEGDVTTIVYFYKSPEKQPSPLQVIRNYQNAVKNAGGQIVWERRGDDGGEATMKVSRSDGQEVWISVTPGIFSAPTNSYKLVIAERAAMVQEVTAGQMLAALDEAGFIALYINFETGSWALTPQAEAIAAQIAQLLKENPKLVVGLEGHTDNVGDAKENILLSENRAKSVMSAVVKQGIPAARLRAAGLGASKPLADNRTEEGRARNRRVELVKKDQ